MSDTKVWSGKADDFDEFYEWAGKRNVTETLEDESGPYRLSVYNPVDGWHDARPGATVEQTLDGLKVVAVKKDEEEPDVETKGTPEAGIENKAVTPGESKPAETTTTAPAKATKAAPAAKDAAPPAAPKE